MTSFRLNSSEGCAAASRRCDAVPSAQHFRFASLLFLAVNLGFHSGALAQAGGAPQQPPAGAAPAQPPEAQKKKSDANLLLSSPIPVQEEFKYLYLRRSWLAGQGTKLDAFESVAEEFAAKGAYFSAVEVLWFADKITDDPTKKTAYQVTMRQWLKLAEPTNQIVEEGLQLFAGGKRQEAIAKFYAAIKANPYCEKGHYQIANTHFLIFLQEREKSEQPIPIPVREKIFRLAYEQLQYTIAIDPLYYDAFYLLSSIREIIPDDPEFTQKSQPLTDRAAAYRGEVLGAMQKVEDGGRDAPLFEALGKGFESVAIMDYAVFAYRIAQLKGSKDPDIAKRLDGLMTEYFSKQ